MKCVLGDYFPTIAVAVVVTSSPDDGCDFSWLEVRRNKVAKLGNVDHGAIGRAQAITLVGLSRE